MHLAEGLAIRSFEKRDERSVIELWNAVFPDDPPRNAPADLIRRKLTVQPELFLVGESSGEVVATVMAGFDGVRGWVHHLAVNPRCRSRGYGREMMRAAEKGLRGLGCPKLNLQVRASNAQVIGFYRALGYSIEDRVSFGKVL